MSGLPAARTYRKSSLMKIHDLIFTGYVICRGVTEKVMDEKTKKRLIHIRDATKVNKQHAEDYKRKQTEFQKKTELYDNRSVNYRKHIRW